MQEGVLLRVQVARSAGVHLAALHGCTCVRWRKGAGLCMHRAVLWCRHAFLSNQKVSTPSTWAYKVVELPAAEVSGAERIDTLGCRWAGTSGTTDTADGAHRRCLVHCVRALHGMCSLPLSGGCPRSLSVSLWGHCDELVWGAR